MIDRIIGPTVRLLVPAVVLPIMWGTGTGSEVMRRIAAPMVGGMITAPLLSMFVVPAVYLLLHRRRKRSLRAGQSPRNRTQRCNRVLRCSEDMWE